MNQKIILVDSSLDFSKFMEVLKNKNHKIITFDYNSHKVLTKEKIEHSVSDIYLDNTILKNIQSESIKFSNWYKHDDINRILSYDEINIGGLFKLEFHNFLIPFLKKFLEVLEITKKFSDNEIMCSNEIFNIGNHISKNLNKLGEEKIEIKLEHDEIKYRIFDNVSLKISKKNYARLKSISEFALKRFLRNQVSNQNIKTGAFIEFDTIKFESIFQKINNTSLNGYLYNRRRPIYWNKKSLSIIKNSKVIPYLDSRNDSNLENITQQKTSIIWNEILEYFDKTEHLSNYFQFDGKSFWESLKPYLLEMCKIKIPDAINEIELGKKFLIQSNISFLVVLSEIGFTEQVMIYLAKKFNITTILLQHGLFFYNNDALEYNKFFGALPQLCDRFFVWGKNTAEYAIKSGYPEKMIEYIGNMNLDRDFKRLEKNVKKKQVLLLATGPRNQHYVGHHVGELENFEKIIFHICNVVDKLGLELIIKRHADSSEHELPAMIKEKFPSVKILKDFDPLTLQSSADFVISLGPTSGILEAQLFGKPVILFEVNYNMYPIPPSLSKTCLNTNSKNFENDFKRLLTSTKHYDDLINAGKISMKENLSNIGNSSEVFLKTLLSI